jgi:hypothetical protein
MAKKSKKDKWFVPVRGSYLPNNWWGWLSYIPFMAYLVLAAVLGWHYTANNYEAILYVVPNWVAAAVVMTWVAKRTS